MLQALEVPGKRTPALHYAILLHDLGDAQLRVPELRAVLGAAHKGIEMLSSGVCPTRPKPEITHYLR